jgi:hypothetical protein
VEIMGGGKVNPSENFKDTLIPSFLPSITYTLELEKTYQHSAPSPPCLQMTPSGRESSSRTVRAEFRQIRMVK